MALKDTFKTDLASILKEIGSSVVYGSYSTYGTIFNDPTETLQMSSKVFSVNDTILTLTIAAGSIGLIGNNTNIVVDGITYLITRYIVLADGLEQKIWLSAV